MLSNQAQLVELLSKLPGQIRDQEKVCIEAKAVVERAKLSLSFSRSSTILETNGNATEKNAMATTETEKEALDLIQAQKEYDLEEAGLKYLENRFIAIRKIVSLEQEMIKSQLSGN